MVKGKIMSIEINGPLLLIGAGKMGGALIEGWLEAGLDPDQVFVQDPAPPEDSRDLLAKYDIEIAGQVKLDVLPDVVVLAVKPQSIASVLADLPAKLGEKTLVISIAAGTTLTRINSALGQNQPVIRAMPNTPAAIGHGMTALFANTHVAPEQKELAVMLLQAVGQVVWLDDETQMDVVTAVSGSGPAYVFYLTECMAEAGISAGLSPDLAWTLARETVYGAGQLMHYSQSSPPELRKNVTSPGGTTQAALEILMADDGLKTLMQKAIEQATQRSKQLSE